MATCRERCMSEHSICSSMRRLKQSSNNSPKGPASRISSRRSMNSLLLSMFYTVPTHCRKHKHGAAGYKNVYVGALAPVSPSLSCPRTLGSVGGSIPPIRAGGSHRSRLQGTAFLLPCRTIAHKSNRTCRLYRLLHIPYLPPPPQYAV